MIWGLRNVRFMEHWTCFVFRKHPFWDSPFCLITDNTRVYVLYLWRFLWLTCILVLNNLKSSRILKLHFHLGLCVKIHSLISKSKYFVMLIVFRKLVSKLNIFFFFFPFSFFWLKYLHQNFRRLSNSWIYLWHAGRVGFLCLPKHTYKMYIIQIYSSLSIKFFTNSKCPPIPIWCFVFELQKMLGANQKYGINKKSHWLQASASKLLGD